MDILICGAPLDSSFQKDKLELVNKGSLGRRRKPSRGNIKNLLSPSNNKNPTDTIKNHKSPQAPSARVPDVACCVKPRVNGHVYKDRTISQNLRPPQRIESSLPRTSPEPNHVADAQQFSIEAKLKRKKSETVGRSAVLIQTWERRTWSNSLTRQKEAKERQSNPSCNRFENKENLRNNAMPEHPACQRYAGNPHSGGSFKKGGLVSRVRDSYSDDGMLYRVPESGPRSIKQLQMNGRKPTTGSSHEPEWISLSKKLCAKFVEGYIEPNSADSYLHEEPDGVKPQPQQVSKHRPQQTTSQTIPQRVAVEETPKKVADMTPCQPTTTPQCSEPPWIHLSRKLCTKFIEEHIEYPILPCDVSKKKPLAVEPNGDVRIIEKVGKPKGRKSKMCKDSEPEWVSLSRKLRAKFIESHIDDPDTISMDNQLNASDLELSSESLSDTSQDVITLKKRNTTTNSAEHKDFSQKIKENFQTDIHKNRFQNNNHIRTPFPEKECCWEYQEMEFDQESNSGTFQEAEFSEDSITDCTKTCNSYGDRISRSVPQENTEKRALRVRDCETFTSFADTVNSKISHNLECYNNDVHFAPHQTDAEKSSCSDFEPEKRITVQFVSHSGKPNREFSKGRQDDISPERNNGPCSFFNLTTWEEAHCKPEETFPALKLKKDLKSKSMENICDSDENYNTQYDKCTGKRSVSHFDGLLPPKGKAIYKSEDILDKLECKISTRTGRNGSKTQGKTGSYEIYEDNVYKTRIDLSDRNSGYFEGGNGVSEKGVASRSTSSESFECFEITPAACENNTKVFGESQTENSEELKKCEEETLKVERGHKASKKRSEDFETTDFSLKCPAHKPKRQCSYESETKANGDSLSYPKYQSIEHTLEDFEEAENDCSLNCRANDQMVMKFYLNVTENDSPVNYPAHKTRRKNSETSYINENGDSNFVTNLSDEGNHEVLETETANSCNSLKILDHCDPKHYVAHQNGQSYNTPKPNSNGTKKHMEELQVGTEKRQCTNATNGQKPTGMKKHFKCNGTIPNTKEIISNTTSTCTKVKEEKITNGFHSNSQEATKDNQDINNKISERLCVNEYANISSAIAERKPHEDEYAIQMGKKSKSVHSIYHDTSGSDDRSSQNLDSRRNSSEEFHCESNSNISKRTSTSDCSSCTENLDSPKRNGMKIKSQSMYDISKQENIYEYTDDEVSTDKVLKSSGCSNGVVKSRKKGCAMTFQEFASESDIPLCAKLVSKQNGKLAARSVSSSSNRNASPCSESSHVYEDMFKETTSCPSDSETSSWTVMKNNSYYINGRSSSMNDLDLSDSCSMSVKCDYASSGSEQSTLQSRHSSYTSSSFYVNLRDYDSHMLEPSLNKKKKDSKKTTSNGKGTKLTNSNPPTPESLRHLFTSPFHSIHSPANRTSKLVTRLPQEPEPHYYSTAAATSSAFKHGFDPTPSKQKKTERSSSVKIKDIAHGIILTFRRFQNHSKSSNVSPNHYVDVSHLAESNHAESGKNKSKKEHKEISKKQFEEKKRWGFSSENSRTDSDSGCHLTPSDVHCPKARRSSSDLTGNRPKLEILSADIMNPRNEKKKIKSGKKASNAREKGKKTRSKSIEPRPVSTVSRKVQQMPDGTLYLVTTVSGDTALPGVYSDSPDSSSELSTHRPVKLTGESNC